ncbi:MAG TPA: hypothetical protein VFX92_00970 [Candidatus Krumholzibacteria bacterium]|nr:hypothetical protein [Candidatus Krumholzibacteria bacterium]
MLIASSTLGISFHPWVVALAAVLIAVGLVAYWRTAPSVAGRARVILTTTRVVVFLLLALLLFDPRSIWRGERLEDPRVVVLVDRSASMSLPEQGWAGGRSRFDAARDVASEVTRAVAGRGARAEVVYFSSDLDDTVDAAAPDGQGTDVVRALESLARRFEGENLAAIVVVSDGVQTDASLVRPALPDIPVWAVGVGDTAAAEDVRLSGVEYSPVARAPSRVIIGATVAATGPRAKKVHIALTEKGHAVFEADTTLAGGDAEVTVPVAVRVTDPGRREFVLTVSTDGPDTRAENNRRDVVIEVEKARTRVLVVDLAPTWELTFLTAMIAHDPAYECELFVSSRWPSSPDGKLKRPDEFVPALAGADAVVLASVDDAFLTESVCDALRRFVTDRGGGLLVLPGTGSLYENAAAWNRLAPVLPLRGDAPLSFTLQYTAVGPGARAVASPITAPLIPLLSQTDWQERAPLLGYYSGLTPTAAGEVLIGVRGRSVPALTVGTAGNGRVAMIAAGPLWRWKFVAESNSVYDELMSRLIDMLTRGEESGRFVLASERNVFETGESPRLFAEILNERLQPVTGAPVRVEVARVDSSGAETPLTQAAMQRESPDAARLSVTLDPLPAGRYVVHGKAELPDRTMESRPLEIRVSTSSVEFQRTPQDREALTRIAGRSGGGYVTPDEVVAAAAKIPLEPRHAPVVAESVVRAEAPLFLFLLALLSVEWLVRKRAGMI